jgi:hypothetical protein
MHNIMPKVIMLYNTGIHTHFIEKIGTDYKYMY